MKIVCAVCSVEQERADRCVECQRVLPGGVGLSPGARPKGVGEFAKGVDLVWKRKYGHLYTNVRWRVRHHSTSGMEVGYMGGGCADFALNVLVALYPAGKGENIKTWQGHVSWRAWALHQDFKVNFLASANGDDGRIPWAEITEWIEAQRGDTHRLMKRYEESLADFTRAIELDENDAWALAQRGETHRLMERYEEALADFTRAIELDETYAWALANRGVTYDLMKRYEEALADFTRAIELDEKYAWAIVNRGEIHRLMERYEESLADFTRVIDLDENDAWALAQRGETHRLMKRYEEALADFTRAIELDEEYAWALASRGVTYRLMERYEEALADSVSAVELDAEETTAHLSIIACYRKLGRMEEYQRQVEIARSVIEKESVYIRACFAAVCGDTENTLALLRRALEDKDVPIDWAMMDPDFDWVREDPRFATLLDETKALLYLRAVAYSIAD